MSWFEKMICRVSPEAGVKRAEARAKLAKIELQSQTVDAISQVLGTHVENSGYSHGGASRRKTFAAAWKYESISSREDIEANRKILRQRSRDLSMNSPVGAAAINTTRTNCIGEGLIPKPKIDYEYLGLSKDEARELEKQIKKEFSLWAENTFCDSNDQNNFYELQQIAFLDWLRNGEEFALIQYEKEQPYMPYQLRIRLIEADRVSTPDTFGGDYDGYDRKLDSGNQIMNGVEITSTGKVIAYYICSKFPESNDYGPATWTRVVKRGRRTGNPNILHIFNAERGEQYRGVPFLAPVIESIKQLTRYTEAEITAAVLNSMLAIFITTEDGSIPEGFGGAEDDEEIDNEELLEKEDDEIQIGAGTVNFLKPGEKVESVSTNHPSQNFDGFAKAMAKYIGAALEIAPEVLLKEFRNNFSASKGAMNETWKAFKMRRKWFVNDFCQEIYVLWFSEAVSKGRIHAPGFFNDPLIRKAYTNCTWVGPTQGQIDPVKEVNAAVTRVHEGFSTREDECAALNGSDYEDNVRTLEIENEKLQKANESFASEKKKGKNDDGSGN